MLSYYASVNCPRCPRRLDTKTKDLTSKAKDFIKCPRGQGCCLQDLITVEEAGYDAVDAADLKLSF
jgi:hypothetical protein